MHTCKSGRHVWFNKDDADKCCNGYTRILVIGGGSNQQIVGSIRMGRAWIKTKEVGR